ncbi:hypothetical protein [Cryptosporangium aurantiacum]|uniref:Uncharacterized protein n=1 Tax=Cryptosporangium aurantiacum TaxID=134849 RepID=A0A1M7N7Y0_9ACTN|nr:hypothetical protein [Cryptosporangium aurantiacum]SHM99705.1 hypothetical protein SAMN05443668_102478 [Cryptosporangium aurantiacum]
MRTGLRRVGRDVARGRHLEVYVVAALALTFATLSVVGDVVPDNLRWAALLAGMALLVYRITVPEPVGSVAKVFGDRTAFEEVPLAARLKAATEVWVFAPSGVNFLSMPHLDLLRKTVLARGGDVRVVVLDPAAKDAVALAVRQLDRSVTYPLQDFRESLTTVLRHLGSVSTWQVNGKFEHRLLDYNPGFSIVAVDPQKRHGRVIVEFHGFHNESTVTRMHLELRRADSERWYAYWVEQFEYIWAAARRPADDSTCADDPAAV